MKQRSGSDFSLPLFCGFGGKPPDEPVKNFRFQHEAKRFSRLQFGRYNGQFERRPVMRFLSGLVHIGSSTGGFLNVWPPGFKENNEKIILCEKAGAPFSRNHCVTAFRGENSANSHPYDNRKNRTGPARIGRPCPLFIQFRFDGWAAAADSPPLATPRSKLHFYRTL